MATDELVNAGGSATAGGMAFQHRVAAWIAVRILAEQGQSPPWDLPSTTRLESLRCETGQPVDDLLVGTSESGFVYIQVKKGVRLSKDPHSSFGASIDQFVRQFLACRNAAPGAALWEDELDQDRDRLVLVTDSSSSGSIRSALPAVLGRVRGGDATVGGRRNGRNAKEREALSVTTSHVRDSWQRAVGVQPSASEIETLLSFVRVQVLDVDAAHSGEREANDLLRAGVLRAASDAAVAWAILVDLCAQFAADKAGTNRVGFQRALLAAGLPLRGIRSYQEDISRLAAYSATTTTLLSDLSRIREGDRTIKIARPSTLALAGAAESGSLLVVGEPGAGKSAALHDVVNHLTAANRDVVFLAVDHLDVENFGDLRETLTLEHDLVEVLNHWPGGEPAFLVIDALDAARGDSTQKLLRDLITLVAVPRSRWHVIVSIRKFDLRYSHQLQELFKGAPDLEFYDSQFATLRHVNVPPLSEGEFHQVEQQSPALSSLIRSASVELRELLRTPFNLRLLAELIGAGVNPSEFTSVSTQLQLLDRYWWHRVIREDRMDDARERVLRDVCTAMIDARALRVARARVQASHDGTVLRDLLSSHILAEWQAPARPLPERDVLTFAHNILFDYAVARLVLRTDSGILIDRVRAAPDLVLVIRPSFLYHFRYLWLDNHRDAFWALVFQMLSSDGVPETGKLLGPSVAAELARDIRDLEPMCAALEDSSESTRATAENALRHVVGTLLAAPTGASLVGLGAGPWCELVERVSR